MRRTILLLAYTLPTLAASAELSLERIDASFIQTQLNLTGMIMDRSAPQATTMSGCEKAKVFSFVKNNALSKIAIALCRDGELGPRNYQATIDENLKPFIPKDEYSGKRAEEAKLIYGITIPLTGNRSGRVFCMPVIGHGLLLFPTAIAPAKGGAVTILIQSDLDIEHAPDFAEHFANLLKALDAEL